MNDRNSIKEQLHWYKDAVIYELHIKAFRDSNADGVGDMAGIIEKLDQLLELGVTAIWLLPFYPSPQKDDGYDIADYYNVNPVYGDVAQFEVLLKEAHARGLRVITELVLNHTSDQHPWFQRARRAPKGSPERNFYVWSDDPSRYNEVRIIFQDFESSNWTWDEVAKQYYWHRFFHHQPDLNFDNPAVQEEILNVISHWCSMGVDGFRLDAVPYLFERDGTNCENLPETHAFLKKLRAHVDRHFPGTMLLAEANMWPEDAASYFGDGDECHMNYHFPLMPRMYMSIQAEDRHAITDIFDQTPSIPALCQWAIFLRNHDELTLEMVTDEERDYMYKTYVRDPKARINLGIRHRLAPLMDNDRRRIELMNSLLFSLPGTPVVYYGDEIGMGDNVYLGDRDGVRTPMQWSADRNAGFSEAGAHQLYLPVIQDPAYHFETINVETQRANTSSLYWFMKRMISIRKRHQAFGRGDIKFLNVENPKVLAFTRSFESETLLIICNLSRFTQPSEVDLGDYAGYTPIEIFSKNHFPVIREKSPYFFTLSPYGFQWFVLSDESRQVLMPATAVPVELKSRATLMEKMQLRNLERNLVIPYLKQVKWFSGHHELIYDCNLEWQHHIQAGLRDVYWFILQVNYKSGLPDQFHFPLCFVSGEEKPDWLLTHPESVISAVLINGKKEFLCDALYTEELQQWMLQQAGAPARQGEPREVVAFGTEELQAFGRRTDLVSRLHFSATQSNTAFTFNNRYFLKTYRKVEPGLHPDLEISRFLSTEMSFPHVPAYFGHGELKTPRVNYPLFLVQQLVENHGTGHSFMQERIRNFVERLLSLDRKTTLLTEPVNNLFDPPAFDELPPTLRTLLGERASALCVLTGDRVARMHLALGGGSAAAFAPESFSLHYQRSLYAAMKAPFREAFQLLKQSLPQLPEPVRDDAAFVLEREKEVDGKLRRIYASKIDTLKIRIHGNLNLPQVLLSGKDIFIHDFGGDPKRNISERRIKRSCLRDAASMIRSFYYVSYESFFAPPDRPAGDISSYLPFASLWAHHMSGFFLRSYLQVMSGSALIPTQPEHLRILMEVYTLEKSFHALSDELRHRPEYAVVPLKLIRAVLED